MKPTFLFPAFLALASSALTQAATLSIDAIQRRNATFSPSVNLTTGGTQDWAYWTSRSGTGSSATAAPSNDKSTGGTIISSLSAFGPGSGLLRGSGTATTVGRYSWSDGSGTGSGTNVQLDSGLVFNSLTGSSAVGNGVLLSITGIAGVNNYVLLYLGGFASTANLSLSLNGVAIPVTNTQIYTGISPKEMTVYQVIFNPDSAGDTLNIQYTATAVTDTINGHVGIEAVTVGLLPVIPEPSVAALAGLGGLALLRRRRSAAR